MVEHRDRYFVRREFVHSLSARAVGFTASFPDGAAGFRPGWSLQFSGSIFCHLEVQPCVVHWLRDSGLDFAGDFTEYS